MKTKGIYFLYRLSQALALPILLLYFLYRSLRSRAYWGSLPQRFGFLPPSFTQTGAGAIWFHAVSVGEVVDQILGKLAIPVLSGLTIGHTDDQLTLPLGPVASLDADKGELTNEEPALV